MARPVSPSATQLAAISTLGSIVEADTERSQQNYNESKGRDGGRSLVSAVPQISSGGKWTDGGPGSWPFTYIRALPSIYIRRRQHAVCGFASLGYVQAVRRARILA